MRRQEFAISRRTFLHGTAAVAVTGPFAAWAHAAPLHDAAELAVQQAHHEIWRRFVDEYDVLLDYTALDGSYDRLTPEECRLGKPNALAWWTPVENGAMFNGLYLDAMVHRALATGAQDDRDKARRLAEGLLFLASVGDVKGFVARSVATDGRTPPAMGSNDQTAPWFYGLWRCVQSGLPDDALRQRIIAKMVEVADVLKSTGWRMPAAAPFHYRGSINGITWDGAPRLLFVMKAMHALTDDASWLQMYEQALYERGPDGRTRVALCEQGLAGREKLAAWTGSVSAACLRGLWELETDADLHSPFARGLAASAEVAAGLLPERLQFDNDGQSHFEGDWRKLNALWRPQSTADEASKLAGEQLTWINKESPRRREECKLVREPAFAAWIVTLCPDEKVVLRHRREVLKTLAYYRYAGLRYSQFFPVESAWWRL